MAYTTLLPVRKEEKYKRMFVADLPENGDQWWRENKVYCYSREYYREMQAHRHEYFDPYKFFQSVWRVTAKDIWYDEITLRLDGGGALKVSKWDKVFVEIKKKEVEQINHATI